MATGEYFAAASAFCRAIKITQLLSEQVTNDEETTSLTVPTAATATATATATTAFWSYEALPVLLADVSYKNQIAIFENCFVAIPNMDYSSVTCTKTMINANQCRVFTAALIYNLALTYHYGGMCGNSRERMNDALNLYSKAFDFLPDRKEEDTRDGRALRLALCNNAASLSLVLSGEVIYKLEPCCTRIHHNL